VMVRICLFLVPFVAAFRSRLGGPGRMGAAPLATNRSNWRSVRGAGTSRLDDGCRRKHPSFDPAAYAAEALRYVAERPQESFSISPQVRALARAQHLTLPANAISAKTIEHVVFFARAEGPAPRQRKVNDPWLAKAVFGPQKVNPGSSTTLVSPSHSRQ
jgi:hypothetical protein